MTTEMTPERLEALLATHGPDAARWPSSERQAAEALLARDAAARTLLAEYTALEELLAAATPEPPAGLEARILKAARTRGAASSPRRWIAGAGALAASLLIGLALGLSGGLSPWPAAMNASPKLAETAPDDDLLTLAWLGSPVLEDAEEVRGERP